MREKNGRTKEGHLDVKGRWKYIIRESKIKDGNNVNWDIRESKVEKWE